LNSSFCFVAALALSLSVAGGGPHYASPIGVCESTLTIGTGSGTPGSAGNPVSVTLTNNQVIRGVQVDVTDMTGLLTATGCTSLVSGLTCSINDTGAAVRVLFFSFAATTIPIGTAVEIFRLSYGVGAATPVGNVPLVPEGLLISDPLNEACGTTGIAGSFDVLAPPCQTDEDCDDTNPCTDDSCDPATGCVPGTPVVCAPADQCHEAGTCNPGSGACFYAAKPNGTTCDDGNASTSGDSCQNGVCIGTSCTSSNDPKTKGWYKSLCHNSHSGDSLTDADAACVGALTTRFQGITTVSEVCAILEPSHPNADNCGKAEDQLMTLALNICKQRVCPSNGIDSSCGNNVSVAQSLAESDAILADPDRTNAECDHAECLDKEINNGHALEFDTLLTTREGGSVRLNWTAPTLDDGTGTPQSYKISRRAVGSMAPFVQIGSTPNVTFLDVTAGTGSWQYNVTPVCLACSSVSAAAANSAAAAFAWSDQ
jgi:hypothetical protein